VPEIIDEFTRERVMVSEWIDGIKVTDDERLKKYGFDQKAIITDIIKGFAEQIFVSGFIHCDPHPGNIFVRPDPKNPKKHQVVILDFGLCIDISDKFRT
jgi:aarF domain-containing kinase